MYLPSINKNQTNVPMCPIVSPAHEGPGVIAEPLAVGGRPGEEDVVHGRHRHVLASRGVAAVRESWGEAAAGCDV